MFPKFIFPQLFICLFLIGATPVVSSAEEPPNEIKATTKKPDQKIQERNYSSVEERRLYTILQNERDNLEEEKEILALQEKELKTLQEEADKKIILLDEKLAELQQLQKKIEELLAQKDVREIKKTKDLSLIYAKMSPHRAALTMSALDEQLAADLLANMKVKSAAKILDQMDKVKASQLSTTFTTIKVE